MLKKKERLTKKEFDNFFSKGKRFHSNSFQLIYTPYENFHGATVVGKKIYKNAVDRNRVRRQLYAVLYQLKQEQKLQGVYIVLAKSAVKGMSYQALLSELLELIGRTQK